MIFLWIGAIEFLVAFKRIGIFIIGKNFSKNCLSDSLITY
jgi:hypothetical protein